MSPVPPPHRLASWLTALGPALGLALALAPACNPDERAAPSERAPIVVLAAALPADATEDDRAALADAQAELTRYLEALTGLAPRVETGGEPATVARDLGAGLVVVLADATPGLGGDAFRLDVTEVGTAPSALDGAPGATVATLGSATRLGRQYAIYELLRRLGARFFHPEDEWLPRLPTAQIRARVRAPTALGAGPLYAPDFLHRAFTFHGAHPLEHLESFSDARVPIAEAERVNRWIVKNRGDVMRGAGRGIAPPEAAATRAAELRALADRLGLRHAAGITLHNQQQGSTPDVDPSSPVPVRDQIEAVVRAAAEAPGTPPYVFGVHFGPTELTTTPDAETVQWIDWAGEAARRLLPGVPVEVNDHITGGQATAHYDDLGCPPGTNALGTCDYYDLAFHTDPQNGAKVHTVMFYPLEGPAPVYGQRSFAHKLCLIAGAAAEGRAVTWFPEGAYWLSFDNAVPVYLPLYLWTRKRDVDLIAPHLATRGGHVREHRMFDSGHEWGYWQQDYAVGLWGWNADASIDDVLRELGDPLCPVEAWPASCAARDELVKVLDEVMAEQRASFLDAVDFRGRPGGLYWYFAGEDPADELGAASGLEFRPVRLAFRDVLALSDADAAKLADQDLAALTRMDAAYADFAARLRALEVEVPAAARPWLDEVVDGLAINHLRAAHVRALYDAALALRADGDAVTPLGRAQAALDEAAAVIARREAGYRYPDAQEFGRGANGTTYPFRVHTKTHELAYWRNRQAQVEALAQGHDAAPTTLVATPVFADPGAPVNLTWPALDGLAGRLDMGDGASVAVGAASHDYPDEPALWSIAGALDADGATLPVRGTVVRSAIRAVTGRGDFDLRVPASEVARTVLGSLVPPLHLGLTPDGLALAAEPAGLGTVSFEAVATAPSEARPADATHPAAWFSAGPLAFELPIADPSTGRVAAIVSVSGATLQGDATARGAATLTGELEVGDLVDALVALAGFDADGATAALASVLGFDPAAPPARIPFEAGLTLRAEAAP